MIELSENSKLQADTLVDVLKQNPELSIEVFGYTDKSGIEDKNIVLSDGTNIQLNAGSALSYSIARGLSRR